AGLDSPGAKPQIPSAPAGHQENGPTPSAHNSEGAAPADARRHVVASGETLSNVAQAAYGDMLLWPVIFAANGDQLHDPDLLAVGTSLILPAVQGNARSPSARDRELVSGAFMTASRFYESRSPVLARYYQLRARRYAVSPAVRSP